MTDGEKERIKLRATRLNGISVATFAVGGLAPSVQLVPNSQVAMQPGGSFVASAACCFMLSNALHLVASRISRKLDR